LRKQQQWRLKREKIVQNFRNFLFENDELLKKILLNKKFLKLIREYAVIFLEFFETFLQFSNLAILYYMYIFFYYFQQVILSIAPSKSAIFLFYETNVLAHNG